MAFLEITGDDTVTDLDCFRLGKYDVNRSRPRPIKIHFKDEQQAKKILQTVRTKTAQIQNDRQLKNVGVSIDRTPLQLSYLQSVKNDLRQRINNGEDNIRIKFIQGVPQIVKSNLNA